MEHPPLSDSADNSAPQWPVLHLLTLWMLSSTKEVSLQFQLHFFMSCNPNALYLHQYGLTIYLFMVGDQEEGPLLFWEPLGLSWPVAFKELSPCLVENFIQLFSEESLIYSFRVFLLSNFLKYLISLYKAFSIDFLVFVNLPHLPLFSILCIFFIFFLSHCFKTFRIVLNKSGESEYPCLVPDSSRNSLDFTHLIKCWL